MYLHLRPHTEDLKNSESLITNTIIINIQKQKKMKNEKKFKFNTEQAELISQSFNDFKNDAIKAISASDTVGGRTKVKIVIKFKKTS